MKGMRTVFEAAGGNEGLHRLADAWHRRMMADEVVSHAFSHGFHPQHVERLAAYWAEVWVAKTLSVRPVSSSYAPAIAMMQASDPRL